MPVALVSLLTLLVPSYELQEGTRAPLQRESKVAQAVGGVPTGCMILGETNQPPSGFHFAGGTVLAMPVDGNWKRVAPMNYDRSNAALATVGERAYAVGGVSANGGGIYEGTLEEYDPAKDEWTVRSELGVPRDSLAAIGHEGLLYAVGGKANGVHSAQIEAYDPTTDQWTPRSPMPTARFNAAVAILDGHLFVIAGDSDVEGPSARVERYDPSSDAWMPMASLGWRRNDATAVTLGGRIYVIGGAVDDSHPFVEEYDPSLDTWTAKAPAPLISTARVGAVVLQHRLLVFTHAWTWEYSPARDSWVPDAPASRSPTGVVATVLDDRALVLAGSRSADLFTPSRRLFVHVRD